jgi:CRISP-associated protein Cas1
MIKHTLEISQRPVRISLRQKQMILDFGEKEERQYAVEDIGVLILEHPAISLSAALLHALLDSGAVVVICGDKHLPCGLLLPTVSHTELVPRMMAQMNADKPARKQAWKQIVAHKITAQANELKNPFHQKLLYLAQNVKSGDSENAEAQAAKIYWPARFPDRYANGDKRDPESESLFNACLNYGYSIIRASVARALVGAGLQPALGVFHHKRDNPFCLADDVMEPLRPLVDRAVAEILTQQYTEILSSDHRRQLLSLLSHEVRFGDQKGPLMAILPRYIASFYRLLTKESEQLDCPKF